MNPSSPDDEQPARAYEDAPTLPGAAPDSDVRPIGGLAAGIRESDRALRYRVGKRLGRGGFADVHVCEDALIGRDVAIKTLRSTDGDRGDALEDFVREARLQGRLEHPAVVPVYDLGTTDDGTPYFTMKRVRGVTLAELLADLRDPEHARVSTWTLRKLLTAFVSVCLAVDYAHRRGVVHRDLKPGNLMFGRFGEVHVLDWGCATRIDGPDNGEAAAGPTHGEWTSEPFAHLAMRVSLGGDIVGTPGYMAPEQARAERVDARADVYALGAILFELLTLEPLHRGTTPLALLLSTYEGVERRPSRRTADRSVPAALDDLTERALAQDAEDRLPSARDLAERVETFLDDEARVTNTRHAASTHAHAARVAADATFDGGGHDARALALREAGRALALDPDNGAARDVLARMLLAPPVSPPPETSRALDATDGEIARGGLRALAVRTALWGALVPVVVLLLGVRDWVAGGVTMGAIALLGAATVAAWRTRRPTRAWRLVLLALTSLVVALFSDLFGPFVIVPALAATTAAAFGMFYGRRERLAAVACGMGAVLLPFALEAAGVLPASTTITHGAIVLHPRLAWFSPAATTWLLLIGSVLSIPVNAITAGRLRDALDDARRKLALHAWQLERTLPDETAR